MHTAPITRIAVEATSRYLATASEDNTVRVWELATGRLVRVIVPPAGEGDEGQLHAVAFSPDGRTIACSGVARARSDRESTERERYAIYLFARESGDLLRTLPVPSLIDNLLFTPEGEFLIATSLELLNSSRSSPTSIADRHHHVFRTSDYQPFGIHQSFDAVADVDGQGRLIVIAKNGYYHAVLLDRQLQELDSRDLDGIPTSVSFSPDGSSIAVAFATGRVGVYSGVDLSRLYEPAVTGLGPSEPRFTDDDLATVAWSADGRSLYYAGGRTCTARACFIRKWSDGGRGAYVDIPVSSSRVTDLVPLKDGRLAYAAADPAFGVLDTQDGRTVLGGATAPIGPAAPPGAEPEPSALTDLAVGAPALSPPTSTGPARSLSESEGAELASMRQQVADLSRQRRYVDALPAARRTVDLTRSMGPRHPERARALVDLAHLYHAIGEYRRAAGEGSLLMDEYRRAQSLYEQAMAIQERVLGSDHVDLLPLLDDMASLLRARNRYDDDADALQRALAIRRRSLGPDHPVMARTLSDLAATRAMKFLFQRRFAAAFPAAQTAVGEAERTSDPMHPSLATALASLAEIHRSFRARDLEAAERLHRRALDIRLRSLGPDHWDVVTCLRSLGDIYVATGQYAQAEQAYTRALGLVEAILGPAHPALAELLRNLAHTRRSLGMWAEAEPLYARLLAIRENEGKAYLVADALEGWADFHRAVDQPARAQPLLERALAIRKARHIRSKAASTLRALGTVSRMTGRTADAERRYQEALDIIRSEPPRTPGRLSLRTADAIESWLLRDLAALALAQDRPRAALAWLTDSLAAQEDNLQFIFRPRVSEDDQLEAAQSRHLAASHFFFLSLVADRFPRDGDAVRRAMDLLLQYKGRVFQAQHQTLALRDHLSPAARQLWERLSAARAELATLTMTRPPGVNEAQHRDELALRLEQTSHLESSLSTELLPGPGAQPAKRATTATVARALCPTCALVEYVKIPDFDYAHEDFEFPRSPWGASSRYLAFILSNSADIRLVDLGSAAPLEELAHRVRTDMHDPASTEWRPHLAALQARLWAPLEPWLRDMTTVIISPDGVLPLVPFAAMLDAAGELLVRRYELVYVTSGRDVIPAAGPPTRPTEELLLVANPAFDAELPDSGGSARGPRPSRDLHHHFDPLPGTEREARLVAALVPSERGHTILSGPEATEAAVKNARGPRILHLATHGFFLPDQALGTAGTAPYEDALVRSGLALAGANRAGLHRSGDDGLLTALEIAGMDLSGTVLVVLSACDTGVGEVKSGEGVFGLRRAFALTGAQNLVMSLWPVDDAWTVRHMGHFYRSLRTMAPAAALRHAQLQTIQELAERLGGDAPPHLWAPFILQIGARFSGGAE